MFRIKIVHARSISSGTVAIYADVLEGAPARLMSLKLKIDGTEREYTSYGFAVPRYGPAELLLTIDGVNARAERKEIVGELMRLGEIAPNLLGQQNENWRGGVILKRSAICPEGEP